MRKLAITAVVTTTLTSAGMALASGGPSRHSFSVRGGQITTTGLMQLTNGQPLGTQTLAITGGTGRYQGAVGEAKFEFVSPSEANITLSVSLAPGD